jgi:hypothetical protein
MKIRTALEGVGAALLLLLPYCAHFLLPSYNTLYYHGLPVTNLVGGLLVDLLGLSILVTGFLVAIRYLPPPVQRILEAIFAGFMLWSFVDFAILVLVNQHYPIEPWGRLWGKSAIAILLLPGVLAYFLPRVTQPAVRALRFALAAVAFSAAWIVPHLLHLAMLRQPGQSAAPNRLSPPMNSSSNQRIVWILFDELSYDQTFEHPASGIRLPNFDQVRAESVSFGNLKPAGFYTSLIIPSLFLGRHINQVRGTIDGELLYKDDPQSSWLAYDPNATLFGIAQRSGWNTGADGWFNPYCRILAPVVNVCSWANVMLPIEEYGASENKSVLTNAAVVPDGIVDDLIHHNHRTKQRAAHIQEYRYIMAHAQALIDDSQVRFVFLHLPVPHPPGIYDRKNHMLLSEGTYLDNLVLADDTLGVLLQEIRATPSASQTTVIISSDHSWRTALWKRSAFWSDEDERVSGGGFDDRPVLLIHFPGQKSGIDINTALPELLEHDLIAAMMLGKINNPEDLAAQLAKYSH